MPLALIQMTLSNRKQSEQINELRAALGPLSSSCEKYCTEACLRRYLEAHSWNVDKSRKMLEESIKWRIAYRPEDIRWPKISIEGETGKMYRASFVDREGRTVVIMRPAKQNTSSHEGQMRFLVYTLENAIFSLPEDQEKMVWLIDFTGCWMDPGKCDTHKDSQRKCEYPAKSLP